MPNSAAFETAFKTLLINNITSPKSLQGNCEKDDSVCLPSLKSFLNLKNDKVDAAELQDKREMEIIVEHLNIAELDTNLLIESCSREHVEKCAAIAYCSGWVATKAKKFIFKQCITCSNKIKQFHKFISRKEYSGKRWLCYPTRELFDFFANIEHITLEILNKYGHKNSIVEYITLIVSINVNFHFIQCAKHKERLMKYLSRKSVVFFTMTWCKEVNNTLTGKSYYNFMNVNEKTDSIFIQAREHYNKRKVKKSVRQSGVQLNV